MPVRRAERMEDAQRRTFAHRSDDWAFHTHARGIHRPASGTRGDSRRGCADRATVPAQPTIRRGFSTRFIEEYRLGIRSYAGTGWPASCEARFAEPGLAQCFLSGLCGLHANAGIRAESRRIDP